VSAAADVRPLHVHGRRHGQGEAGAFEALVPLVSADLRRLERTQRRWQSTGDTLDTTGLVNGALGKRT
jgi:hypothetical protein